MAAVTIYTTNYCPYCTRAKGLLKKKHVDFTEIDVTSDPGKRAWLLATTGQQTVPQVFINGRSIGGSDDLYALDRGGQLDVLLSEPAASSSPR